MLPGRHTDAESAPTLRLSRAGASLAASDHPRTDPTPALGTLTRLIRQYQAADLPIVRIAPAGSALAQRRRVA